jgi:hypothetical protein
MRRKKGPLADHDRKYTVHGRKEIDTFSSLHVSIPHLTIGHSMYYLIAIWIEHARVGNGVNHLHSSHIENMLTLVHRVGHLQICLILINFKSKKKSSNS